MLTSADRIVFGTIIIEKGRMGLWDVWVDRSRYGLDRERQAKRPRVLDAHRSSLLCFFPEICLSFRRDEGVRREADQGALT